MRGTGSFCVVAKTFQSFSTWILSNSDAAAHQKNPFIQWEHSSHTHSQWETELGCLLHLSVLCHPVDTQTLSPHVNKTRRNRFMCVFWLCCSDPSVFYSTARAIDTQQISSDNRSCRWFISSCCNSGDANIVSLKVKSGAFISTEPDLNSIKPPYIHPCTPTIHPKVLPWHRDLQLQREVM